MTRNRDFHRNDLPAAEISRLTIDLLGEAGDELADSDREWIAKRADRGWCAAEIARASVRANFAKGSAMRRKLLVALSKLGARSS